MTFFDYLDAVYFNENVKLQTMQLKKEFCIKTEANTRAIPDLLGAQRKYYKARAYVLLVLGYLVAKVTGDHPKRVELQKVQPKPELKAVPAMSGVPSEAANPQA